MHVRLAQPGDDAFIVELANHVGLDVNPSSERARDQAILCVAEVEEGESERARLYGFILAWSVASELEILDLAVVEGARRKGVGILLLESLLCQAREVGCQKAFLEVRESNLGAQRLYTQAGFSVMGRRERYYSGGEDALVFHACLDGGS